MTFITQCLSLGSLEKNNILENMVFSHALYKMKSKNEEMAKKKRRATITKNFEQNFARKLFCQKFLLQSEKIEFEFAAHYDIYASPINFA